MTRLSDTALCPSCGNLAYPQGRVDGPGEGEFSIIYECENCKRRQRLRAVREVNHEQS